MDLPADETKRLPGYPTLPAVLIGRLAADRRFERRGLGELMLMNGVHRTMPDSAAAFALLVDAGDGAEDASWLIFKGYGRWRALRLQCQQCGARGAPGREGRRTCSLEATAIH